MGPPPAPALLQQGGELLRSMWGQRDARALLTTSVTMVTYVETVKVCVGWEV
jgi:hypothetical protein